MPGGIPAASAYPVRQKRLVLTVKFGNVGDGKGQQAGGEGTRSCDIEKARPLSERRHQACPLRRGTALRRANNRIKMGASAPYKF